MSKPITRDRLVEMRRHLHAHPELSNQEHETSQYVLERLKEFGFDEVEVVAGTGVVALVEGTAPGAQDGPTLAYRADIDALPIEEVNNVDYASQNEGVMHACGHDVHTTIGLGVAAEVLRRRDELAGRVKFIFQPAEEATPQDEPVGAEKMALAGVLDDPDVDAIFALHCQPALDVGTIGHTGGPVWASSGLVDIEITGKKAHGALPHEGVDAGLVASQIVVSLQSVISRMTDARDACVLSFGEISAGDSYNILPERAKMTGILRSLSAEVSEAAKKKIRKMAQGIAEGFGAEADVSFTQGARPVHNDLELEEATVDILRDALPDGTLVDFPPQLAAEDFAAFSRRVPGCYLFLGIRNEAEGITSGLHTPTFDVDEACLPLGVEAMTTALLETARRRTRQERR
jgi:amidohydrolase